MTLMGLLLLVLVVCVVLWAIQQLLRVFAVGEPVRTVIWVVVVLLVLGYVLESLHYGLRLWR